MNKIVFLPLDERPCNYNFPMQLAKDNEEICLVAPDKSILGKKKEPADYEEIKKFLAENCKDAYGLILSVDMLLYGGIVPSRLHYLSESEILKRLAFIDELKRENPKLKIYASCLVMRCPTYNSSDEEPDYYGTCGEEIHKTGIILHKHKLGLISDDEFDTQIKEYNEKTGEYLTDYVERRKKNLVGVLNAIAQTKTNIDYFVIPQDDSAPYGFTAMDQKVIREYMANNGIDGIRIYPGADEVGLTLLSRMICDMKDIHKKIFVIYPENENRNVIPLYEDREIYKTLNSQIQSAGHIETDDYEQADMVLFYNVNKEQIEITEYSDSYFKYYKDTGYLDKIDKAFKDNKKIILADKYYANGGDLSLVKYLNERYNVFDISGYAGWNTSSNSVGTAICMATFNTIYGVTKSFRCFFVERILEDIGFCCFARWRVPNAKLKEQGASYHDISKFLSECQNLIKEDLDKFLCENFSNLAKKYYISKIYSPWKRMFELGVEVDECR